MVDLRKGGNKRLVYKLFKSWPRKARVKKSSVKWKCEKEIVHMVHNYSVTGREPRKNVLKVNLLILWAIFLFFQRSLPFYCYIYFHKWPDVQKWCSHTQIITGRTWYNKSRTKLFTLSKQTFPSHVSKKFFQAVLMRIEENSEHFCL